MLCTRSTEPIFPQTNRYSTVQGRHRGFGVPGHGVPSEWFCRGVRYPRLQHIELRRCSLRLVFSAKDDVGGTSFICRPKSPYENCTNRHAMYREFLLLNADHSSFTSTIRLTSKTSHWLPLLSAWHIGVMSELLYSRVPILVAVNFLSRTIATCQDVLNRGQ